MTPANRRSCSPGHARLTLVQATLGDQKAALLVDFGERDQLVAGHAAPGRQILVHRDFGGADLQQAASRHRVNLFADQQQQAVFTVEVAAVEADVGPLGVLLARGHHGRLVSRYGTRRCGAGGRERAAFLHWVAEAEDLAQRGFGKFRRRHVRHDPAG